MNGSQEFHDKNEYKKSLMVGLLIFELEGGEMENKLKYRSW